MRGAARDRRSGDDLVHNLARMVCLPAMIERPIIRAHRGMEVPELVVPEVFLKIHEAQVQLAMKDGPMERARGTRRQPATRYGRHEKGTATAAQILASDQRPDELGGGARSSFAAFRDLIDGEWLAFESLEDAQGSGGNNSLCEQQGDEGIQQGRGDDTSGEGDRLGEILRDGGQSHVRFQDMGDRGMPRGGRESLS